MTHIVAISDTHNTHFNLVLPRCDVLIHAGDATDMGEQAEIMKFLDWFQAQDAKLKIYVPGNHDLIVEDTPKFITEKCVERGIELLIDRDITYKDIKIYGSPWTPKFGDWAFMDDDYILTNRFTKIPNDTDILITHGPPYGVLDKNNRDYLCGSQALMQAVLQRNIKYHVFGHIHEQGRKMKKLGEMQTQFVNAAIQVNWFDKEIKNPMEFIVT